MCSTWTSFWIHIHHLAAFFWQAAMLSAHLVNFWPLASRLANLWHRLNSAQSCLSDRPSCHRNPIRHEVSLDAAICYSHLLYPSVQIICLEIHFSPRSQVHGFCDIWIVAAHLRGSEEYVNDLHSSSFSFPLLSIPPSIAASVLC